MKRCAVARDQRGVALLIVIWLLVILAALAAELALSARADIGAVRNFKEGRETYHLARAGVAMAQAEILEDWDFVYLHAGQVRFGKSGDETREPEYAPRAGVKLGDGQVSYVITDENAKLNLNALARNEGQLRLLFNTLFPDGVDGGDAAIEGILDWVDADNAHHPNGAEDEYYEKQQPPYHAKNGDFDNVSELRQVRGISPAIFAALEKSVTVHAIGALNPNTAAPELLAASGISAEQVANIMAARQRNGFADANARSDVFVITATGKFEGSSLSRSVRMIVRKTAPRRLTVLEWHDEYYDAAPSPVEVKKSGN